MRRPFARAWDRRKARGGGIVATGVRIGLALFAILYALQETAGLAHELPYVQPAPACRHAGAVSDGIADPSSACACWRSRIRIHSDACLVGRWLAGQGPASTPPVIEPLRSVQPVNRPRTETPALLAGTLPPPARAPPLA